MGPDLSVVIVTFNGREMALQTLRSARAALGSIHAEWFVVDNGSSDGTADAVEHSFPDARVFRERNRGFAAGNNVALEHVRGRYVLLLNPDVEIADGTFADLISAMDARPEVGVASVLQHATDGTRLASIRRFPTPARAIGEALGSGRMPFVKHLQELDDDFTRYDQERSVDWLVGAFLIARREAVEQVGPMDDGFFLYSEEIDWCLRFRRAGWDVRHLPVMRITHHEGPNKRADLVAQLGHSRRRYAYKHFSFPAALVMHASLVLNHLLRLAVVAPAAALKPHLRARAQAEAFGLRVLCGAPPPYGVEARRTPGR